MLRGMLNEMPQPLSKFPTSGPELFKFLLKQKRKLMSRKARYASRRSRAASRWLWPATFARRYMRYVREIIARLQDIALPRIKANLQRWCEESQKTDRADGGAGSGNFGHAGRPGEVGGSAPNGGGGGESEKESHEGSTKFSSRLSEQFPHGLYLYHETPIHNLEHIKTHGLTGNDGGIFATINEPSNFVKGEKAILRWRVSPRDYELLTKDMRYGSWKEFFQEHQATLSGADVFFSEEHIPSTSLLLWGTQNDSLVRKDTFSEEFQDLDDELEDAEGDIFDDDGVGWGTFDKAAILAFLLGLASATGKWNNEQWGKYTKAALGQSYIAYEPWVKETTQAWANANFKLVKSLCDDYIKQLNFLVSDGVAKGRTWTAIMKDIQAKDWNISKAKTKLLARDQIGKLNGRMAKRRQQEAGVDLYEWSTSRDERVRDSHRVLDGKICTYADDTVYAESVEDALAGNWLSRSSIDAFEGIPGEDFQCRCEAIPVMAEVMQQIDNEIDEEETAA